MQFWDQEIWGGGICPRQWNNQNACSFLQVLLQTRDSGESGWTETGLQVWEELHWLED